MTATHPEPLEVLPVAQARDEFSRVVSRFRAEGISARPVVYGSHRKPEAVTIPYAMFQALLPAMEDILLAETVRARLGQPEISWDDALSAAGVTQEGIDAINLDDYVIEGR